MRRRTSTLRPLLCAGLLSLTLLLAGCSDAEPTPKFEEPTASPTPSPEKKETAEEFIRRWSEADTAMQNTGETAEYKAITQGCESCAELVSRVEQIYGVGGSIDAADREIQRIAPQGNDQYLVWTKVAPTRYTESPGAAEQTTSGGENLYRATLKKTQDSFVLVDLYLMPR